MSPAGNHILDRVREMASVLGDPPLDAGRFEELRTGYSGLAREDKPAFFDKLQAQLEVEPDRLAPHLTAALEARDDPAAWRAALWAVRDRIDSPRSRLFRRFIAVPGGLKFLLDLRADLLRVVRTPDSPDLGPLDHDLERLFESWFHAGFLYLEEISLDSPYRQIEKIKNGDMVHPMTSLEEMGLRLGRDRRCFALYHRAMPGEPVVFIEAALTRGIVRSIHEIIGGEPGPGEGQPDTAVFYSINNTQNGLAGLGLGKVLIFQVVAFLKQAAPDIRNFVTLSPMPGFWRRYLRPILTGEAEGFRLNREELIRLLDKKSMNLLKEQCRAQGGEPGGPAAEVLLAVFSSNDWAKNEALVDALAKPLSRIGHIYLSEEKDARGRPLDPVAGFHLGNGASLSPANVNFGANWSAKGLERSLSLMVNYVYSPGWRQQIYASMARLTGLLPGLSRRKTDRLPA